MQARRMKAWLLVVGTVGSVPARADIWADLKANVQRFDEKLLMENAKVETLLTSQTLVSPTTNGVMYVACAAQGGGEKKLRCRMVEYEMAPAPSWGAPEWADMAEFRAVKAMSASSQTLVQDFAVFCQHIQGGFSQANEQPVHYDGEWNDMLKAHCQGITRDKARAFLEAARRYQENACYARLVSTQELSFRLMAPNSWGNVADDCDRELFGLTRNAKGEWQLMRKVRPMAKTCDPSLNDDKLATQSDRWYPGPMPGTAACAHVAWKESDARHELAVADRAGGLKIENDLDMANDALKTGDYAKAMQITNRILKKDPSRWYGYMVRSMANDALGKDFEAGDDVLTALRTQPKDKTELGDSAFNLLRLLHVEYRLRKGQGEGTLADLDKILASNPNSYQAALKRGKALAQAKRYKEAIQWYRKGIGMISAYRRLFNVELDALLDRYRGGGYFATNAEALNELARLLVTVPEPSLRNPTLAYRFAKNAFDRAGGQDVRFIETLALTEAEMGQVKKAQRTLKQGLGLPTLSEADKKRLNLQLKELKGKKETGLAEK